MKSIVSTVLLLALSITAQASPNNNETMIKTAVHNYIASQHTSNESLMANALHPKLAKRTYWQSGNNKEFIMESSYNTMLKVAKTYNKNNDKFPIKPRIDIAVLDIDQRAASVKLTADDWIDYMHLIKTEDGDWKIINVLWQYHDISKHKR